MFTYKVLNISTSLFFSSSFYFQVCCVLSGTAYVVCFFEPWMALRIEWADKFFLI